MKIRCRPLEIQSTRYSREHGIARSLGCHVSEVIERIVAREDGQYRKFSDETTERMRSFGFMHERAMSDHAMTVAIERGEDDNYLDPGEMFWCYEHDEVMSGGDVAQRHCENYHHHGIFFTVDRMIINPWSVKEWKFTYMSSKRVSETHIDIPKYLYQGMWYCFGMETLLWEGEIAFAHGDYKPGPPEPDGKIINIEFDPREIHKNKIMIISNAKAEGLL